MSRLTTFLTYKDYDEFISTHHCGDFACNALNLNMGSISAFCRQQDHCKSCIYYRDNPFKAETLLTEKETSNV